MGESRKPPRLLFNGLGGRVFVITRYTEKETDRGTILLTAIRKFDVTADFERAMKERASWKRSERRRRARAKGQP